MVFQWQQCHHRLRRPGSHLGLRPSHHPGETSPSLGRSHSLPSAACPDHHHQLVAFQHRIGGLDTSFWKRRR
eukprot:symbB.v1.2.024760.t1/scaffold2368.1/size81091/3